ncbi:hypothetical protein QB22_004391 [Salmonella enterica subsp. enterica]|uniref:Uncharacterized protein n=2 Tax=Salmonella enterica I TaxID=59201 RepID=A0A734D3X3_SALTM|nr:hypothetical protein [Salmonella enterica subsp. enterica serovar Braenderup]EDQ4602192.1 hypothetical protein [Salmonella enterica subsp. enterica]EDW0809919.1 hypothetical protein [Salmonella enterica subsp. enterica serovar Lexington]EDW2813461.1 hypothetical protein [Salmonella enterica subsp. enterica serovar Muenchen]EDW3017020.1 hypothetical protein [Salmonella enterica]EEJ3253806.1 hypothetical protein [Salmonella enterica subsp. enterica serovar Leeuwarden]EGW5755102.1 hypothetica
MFVCTNPQIYSRYFHIIKYPSKSITQSSINILWLCLFLALSIRYLIMFSDAWSNQ